MKRILCLFLASLSCLASGATQAELDAYLPILKLFQAERYPEAVSAAQTIAPQNQFAAVALYLVYSRGYCNTPVSYASAAKFFDILYRYEGSFGTREYHDVWRQMRPAPTKTEKIAILKGGKERFQLKGKYPLAQCYWEEMDNVGGVGARALFVVAQSYTKHDETLQQSIVEIARKEGSACARQWPVYFESFTEVLPNAALITPEAYRRLTAAADSGHVPSMLIAAGYCQQNTDKVRPDPVVAGRYLKLAVAKCQTYEAIGCKHAAIHLKMAKEMLKSVPDITLPTPALLDDFNKSYGDEKRRAALLYEIAGREDHPSCLYFKSMLLPKSEEPKAHAMTREAAINGSHEAIRALLDRPHDKEYWFALYLAGKHKLPLVKPKDKDDSYFRRSYLALAQEKMSRLTPAEYLEALKQLAEAEPWAKEAYQREFGGEEKKTERISWKIRDEKFLSAEWLRQDGHVGIKLKITPSEDENYIDFTFQEVPGETNFTMFIKPGISGLSNYDVRGDIVLPDKTRREINAGSSYSGKRPAKMRLNILPTGKTFELILVGME